MENMVREMKNVFSGPISRRHTVMEGPTSLKQGQ